MQRLGSRRKSRVKTFSLLGEQVLRPLESFCIASIMSVVGLVRLVTVFDNKCRSVTCSSHFESFLFNVIVSSFPKFGIRAPRRL